MPPAQMIEYNVPETRCR